MVQMRWCDIYVADFETTVDENIESQISTEVWAGGFADIKAESFDPVLTTSIEEWWSTLLDVTKDKKNIVFFHNEKFDGSFIVSYLLSQGYTTSFDFDINDWKKDNEMDYKSIRTTISTNNEWYEIGIRINEKKYIYIRDSLKLLPFSLDEIGSEFGKNKLELDYIKNRKPGSELTDDEIAYLRRDIGILWFALRKFIINNNHTGMTIGSCCKTEYMKSNDSYDVQYYFPNIARDGHDEYFRRSYRGGICYVNPEKQGKILENGCTLDMNSMYPFVMMSKRKYPIGKPHFFKNKIPYHVFDKEKVYFIHFECSFKIKDYKMPWVQVHNSPYFCSTDILESSYIDDDKFIVEFTMNEVDWNLFYHTYDIEDFKIIDGAWFWSETGDVLFGNYMEKYAEEKKNSQGIDKTISKLFLNNLAGKLSAKPESTTRIPYLKDDGILAFKNVITENVNKAWYIPAASFITAYGRELLVTAANENYNHFVYCDTDSLHLDCTVKYVKYLNIHPTEFGYWKIEREWCEGLFFKQKQYLERDKYSMEWYIICAGMCRRSKELLKAKLNGQHILCRNKAEVEFMKKDITIKDFKAGFSIPGNLMSKRVKGGTLLIPVDFTLL